MSDPQYSAKITQTFNGRTEWGIPGGYFKLLAASSSVDVELWKDGRKVLDALASDAGFYQRIPFDKVVLVNSVSQAVSFLAAGDQGGSDRFTGSFDLVRASALTDSTQVVGVAAAQVLAASTSRKVIYFRARTGNTADIILGSSAVTANGAIRLVAGAEKVIEDAAPAAWFAISTVAGQNLDILTAQ